MTGKTKIGLLCNNKMAAPALMSLARSGMVTGVATADNDNEVIAVFGKMCGELGIPYEKIVRKNHEHHLREWLEDTNPDVVFVMTFPWRIPASILIVPGLGFLNFHYGLLPEMRGADPIFESIRQRMPFAGVSVHVMNSEFDAGPLLMSEQVPLPAEYTYGMLSSQVALLGDQLCNRLIQDLKENRALAPVPQDEARARYWPKVDEAAITIRWNEMTSQEITALVRACNPVAKGAPTMINNWKIGVCEVIDVNLEGDVSALVPGTIVVMDQQNGLIVYCKDGRGLRLEVVYTAEGILPGYKLAFFGIANWMVFG